MLFVICRERSVGKPPCCVFKKMLESILEEGNSSLRPNEMVTAVLREASCERGGREQLTCANLFAWYR